MNTRHKGINIPYNQIRETSFFSWFTYFCRKLKLNTERSQNYVNNIRTFRQAALRDVEVRGSFMQPGMRLLLLYGKVQAIQG